MGTLRIAPDAIRYAHVAMLEGLAKLTAMSADSEFRWNWKRAKKAERDSPVSLQNRE